MTYNSLGQDEGKWRHDERHIYVRHDRVKTPTLVLSIDAAIPPSPKPAPKPPRRKNGPTAVDGWFQTSMKSVIRATLTKTFSSMRIASCSVCSPFVICRFCLLKSAIFSGEDYRGITLRVGLPLVWTLLCLESSCSAFVRVSTRVRVKDRDQPPIWARAKYYINPHAGEHLRIWDLLDQPPKDPNVKCLYWNQVIA